LQDNNQLSEGAVEAEVVEAEVMVVEVEGPWRLRSRG
jgi:hypothetical protein